MDDRRGVPGVAILREFGYELESATAWDLYPMTHHVETVATFRRG
jgi:tRNA/tmRNA/rRNA uracil-C5-methylase (TrmA/RlmC/RlmD family)